MAVTHCVSRFPGWMLVSWQCPTPLYLLSMHTIMMPGNVSIMAMPYSSCPSIPS